MTERLSEMKRLQPDLGIPIVDPYKNINPIKKLWVINDTPIGQVLLDAELGRKERIEKHRETVIEERRIMDQRRAEMSTGTVKGIEIAA